MFARKKQSKHQRWLLFRKEFLKDKQNWEGYYVCDVCHRWVQAPHVHHKIHRSLAPDKVFDKDNLQIVCDRCHRELHA